MLKLQLTSNSYLHTIYIIKDYNHKMIIDAYNFKKSCVDFVFCNNISQECSRKYISSNKIYHTVTVYVISYKR